ncbi:uncharacterized protein FPOAC1_013827 [Fusarium poae]|uniref:uncharacterized protein n=1 Tax=Fusarium poae TaxID=36050 RepID=UPI001D0412E4|nr:uncharacterized protein FPOAC1_013827 [Fusarium poae]KAG8664488.1 hypothetical protein FPOAC1_013827 [Fusarium poae]
MGYERTGRTRSEASRTQTADARSYPLSNGGSGASPGLDRKRRAPAWAVTRVTRTTEASKTENVPAAITDDDHLALPILSTRSTTGRFGRTSKQAKHRRNHYPAPRGPAERRNGSDKKWPNKPLSVEYSKSIESKVYNAASYSTSYQKAVARHVSGTNRAARDGFSDSARKRVENMTYRVYNGRSSL